MLQYIDPSCVSCGFASDFRELVRKERGPASTECQQKVNLLLRELVSTEANPEPFLFIVSQAEIMVQEGLQLELPEGDSGLNISLFLTVSCHRPTYVLYTGGKPCCS